MAPTAGELAASLGGVFPNPGPDEFVDQDSKLVAWRHKDSGKLTVTAHGLNTGYEVENGVVYVPGVDAFVDVHSNRITLASERTGLLDKIGSVEIAVALVGAAFFVLRRK